jgi:Domain of unknown function (DUF4403)
VPIDVPFSEVNRLIAAQIAGKTYPRDRSGQFEVTIDSASVAPSGDRLLISLRVKASDKSWFGLATQAGLHIWVRPVLDRERQMIRLTDISADVESEAAFGLLGAAARAAVPVLTAALAEYAVVDLKPYAANARARIEAALADVRTRADGVQVDAAVVDLRLVGIAFDGQMMRVTAEADGTVNVAVAALPLQ